MMIEEINEEEERLIELYNTTGDCPPNGEKNMLFHSIRVLEELKEQVREHFASVAAKETN